MSDQHPPTPSQTKTLHRLARSWAHLIVLFVFIGLAGFYLSPGTEALFDRRTDTVLSDDTDPSTLPYTYETLRRTFDQAPTDLLYGAVFIDRGSPSGGGAAWIPWVEKWVAVAASFFLPFEQISTFFVYFLLVVNGLSFYALGRQLSWSRTVSLGLGLAWAFNPYTLARAQVHPALAGIYHLPLIFLGLTLILQGRSRRSVTYAALCFLAATSTAHYLIITAAFVSPFFILYLLLQKNELLLSRLALRTFLALLPALVFLIFCVRFPVPPHVQMAPEKARPQSLMEIPEGELHPFLTRFAAQPLDYLSGNIALGARDPNPLRGAVNTHILENLKDGFAHEHATGIRWIFLLILLCIPVLWCKGKLRPVQKQILFFLIFGFFGFWLSLAPGAFGFPGPSEWLYRLIKNIRVPSRANILTHFSVLILAGLVLSQLRKSRRVQWLLIPGLLPALVILELPPVFQPMPMASIRPRFESLAREKGSCGPGLHFPISNFDFMEVNHYHFIQRLRGSDCILLNNDQTRDSELALLNRFPYLPQFFTALNDPIDGPKIADAFEALVRCVPVKWIAFDAATSPRWREEFCKRLNWKLNSELVCAGPSLAGPIVHKPEECFK